MLSTLAKINLSQDSVNALRDYVMDREAFTHVRYSNELLYILDEIFTFTDAQLTALFHALRQEIRNIE